MTPAEYIGKRLKAVRLRRGISLAHLARLSQKRAEYISRIEKAESGSLRLDTIVALARALDVPIVRLFSGLEKTITSQHSEKARRYG